MALLWFKSLRDWLEAHGQPPPVSRSILLAGFLLGLVAAGLNYTVRLGQYHDWQAAPSLTHYQGAPLVSTNDAGYFLALAAALKDRQSPADHQRLRVWPENRALAASQPDRRSGPLLSVLLARLAPDSQPASLLKTAHALLPVTGFATGLMIWAAFAALGWPAQGAVAALGGGLSAAYLVRSSVGRIDTDQLNLGFFYGLFALIFLAARQTDERRSLGFALLAGLAGQLFYWWYAKAELIWMAAAALFWLSLVRRRSWLCIGLQLGGFLALAGAPLPQPWESSYLQDSISLGQLRFVHSFSTITEIQPIAFADALILMTGSLPAGLFCLAGLLFFCLRYPVWSLASLPLFGFFLLLVFLGNRAVFYSAPAFWFGGAFLAAKIIAALWARWPVWPSVRPYVQPLSAALMMIAVLPASPLHHLPRPSFSPQIIAALDWLAGQPKDRPAVLASWWDYGYISQFIAAMPSLHDPGAQTGARTHYIARALLSPDQRETAQILRLIAEQGEAGLALAAAGNDLDGYLASLDPEPGHTDIYLLVTAQMAGWMGAISQLGNWDPQQGQPLIPAYNEGSPQLFYHWLDCHPGPASRQLGCGQTLFDLEQGRIDRRPDLQRLVRTRDGFAETERLYDHPGKKVLQTGIARNRPQSWLIHPDLYHSSFNQLFFLGADNSGLFKLVYDDYPYARIYLLAGS